MNPIRFRLTSLLAGLLLCTAVQAAPLTFNFHFANPDSSAQAVGHITFDDALLLNPGNNEFNLPDPAVLALSVTVSGATVGNGTFTLDDFCTVYFDTNGATLDFSQQLVDQSTPEDPWGTPSEGGGGDFNLVNCYDDSEGSGNGAPSGVHWFILEPDPEAGPGEDDWMELVSMMQGAAVPAMSSVAIPTLSWHALLLLSGLMGLIGMWVTRRRSQI